MSDSSAGSAAWLVTPAAYGRQHPPAHGDGFERQSRYVTVRDGTDLAVDVHLPRGYAAAPPPSAGLPTIVIFTPYYRRFALSSEASGDASRRQAAEVELSPNTARYRDHFVPHGYAVVVVDVRGTGASFGFRDGFRSPRERLDYADIVDWMVEQPWCDGQVGSMGISYLGAAADFLATTGHPAVKAVIPMFSVWDSYADQFYPGGLRMTHPGRVYSEVLRALDLDQREGLQETAYFAEPAYAGPAPVDGDSDAAQVRAAIAEHAANVDVSAFFSELEYRDSGLASDAAYTSATISPYHYVDGIDPATAYYCISGWMDGSNYTNGAVKRFLSLPNADKRLLLGPWDHGARTNVSPYRDAEAPQFELFDECLRFFDEHLKGIDTGLSGEEPVHYFTMVAEAWKSAESWPAAGSESMRWYFAPGGALVREAPAGEQSDASLVAGRVADDDAVGSGSAADEYVADGTVGSGSHTRFERLAFRAVSSYYDDWQGRDARMLHYTSEPLTEDVEVSGHAVVTLHVESTAEDGAFFVYLEDVGADGACRYVSEGCLRAIHRKRSDAPPECRGVGPYHSFRRDDAEPLRPGVPAELTFSLAPTSWRFRAGHRIRVAVTTGDHDHIVPVPEGKQPTIKVHRSGVRASGIVLPVMAAGEAL